MIKLYLADVNYNIIAPINLTLGGVTKLEMNQEVSTARVLDIQFNTYLQEMFDFLLLPETCLVLELDNYKIGFSRSINYITDIAGYAETGAGSDFKSCIKMNNNVNQLTNYLVINEAITDNIENCYYISNESIKPFLEKRYYQIKPYSFSNTDEKEQQANAEQLRQRLYNNITHDLKRYSNLDSVGDQKLEQNGVVNMKLYSSSLDLQTNKRTLVVNKTFKGKLSQLINELHPDFIFEVLDDVDVSINTGCYSNFELLNQIIKDSIISWREAGLVTDSNNKIKTKIQIGNFDKLSVSHLATNLLMDNWFDNNSIRISNPQNTYPAINADAEVKKFILEGDRILMNYREYIEDIRGIKREIFNFQKVKSYKVSSIDLLEFTNK